MKVVIVLANNLIIGKIILMEKRLLLLFEIVFVIKNNKFLKILDNQCRFLGIFLFRVVFLVNLLNLIKIWDKLTLYYFASWFGHIFIYEKWWKVFVYY